MRRYGLVLAALAALALMPVIDRLGLVGGAIGRVALCVVVACAASAGVSAATITYGAIAAITSAVAWSISPTLGGAVLFAVGYAERTSRVYGRWTKLMHFATATLAGGVAAALSVSYVDATLSLRCAAWVVGAVLVSVPSLFECDDELALAIEGAAQLVSEPLRSLLHHACELRRQERAGHIGSPAPTWLWRQISDLASARARAENSRSTGQVSATPSAMGAPYRSERSTPAAQAQAKLDAQIQSKVAELTKTHARASAAHCADIGSLSGVD